MGPETTQSTPPVGTHNIASTGFSTSVTDTTMSEAIITLRKRRWVLVVAAIFGLAYGIFKAVTQPRFYESYARIQVRTGSSNEYRVGPGGGYNDDPANKLYTEVNILQSDSLMLTVAREMDLANNPTFLEMKTGTPPHADLNDPAVRQQTVHRLQSNLHVTLVTKTDIIRISYDSLSPKLSTDIVNKVVDAYIHRSYQTRFDSTQRVSQWLSGTLDDLKQQVETSQEQLIELQKKLGVLGFDPTHNQISSSLDALSKAAGDAKINRIVAESRYRVLAGMDPDTIEGSIEMAPGTAPGELNQLRSQLATAKSTYAELTATLGPNHPQVLALKAQIEEISREKDREQSRLLLQSKQTYIATRAAEDQTNAALDTEKSNANKLKDDLVEYTLRQRDFDSNRNLYDGLRERLRTAGVQAGLESLEIDIIDRALPPAYPMLKPESTIVITTLIFSLLGGIVVSFLLESLDTGLRTVAEIENITELPSLAIIPKARKSAAEDAANLTTAQRNISVLTQSKGMFSEAFRSLRTSLLLSTTGKEPKLILFTSATPSEGKTTTATNLAVVLSQGSSRVLLIDADLRRPNIHHRFGLNGKIGLTTLITGATQLEDTIQQIPEAPNLYVLPSGPVPPFPTEMLASQVMDDLLKRCMDLYDFVIIDSPPILSVTDGVVLARQCDAVVLVVRHGKSSKHVVRRARDLLLRSGARITGIVLNAVDMNSPEYYGYYGYSGYSYSSVDVDSWEAGGRGSKARKSAKEKL